jgi:hypothetical protein
MGTLPFVFWGTIFEKWGQNGDKIHAMEKRSAQQVANRLIYLVRPARLERAACGFEVV